MKRHAASMTYGIQQTVGHVSNVTLRIPEVSPRRLALSGARGAIEMMKMEFTFISGYETASLVRASLCALRV